MSVSTLSYDVLFDFDDRLREVPNDPERMRLARQACSPTDPPR